MFIKYKDEKIVNLDNVSNIFVDEKGQKVIFNMSYSVKIFGNKITPDYVYWPYNNLSELNDIKKKFLYNIGTWIHPIEEGQRYVNTNCISSIVTDEYKNRVIFNLNYNISHPKEENKLTSDFVFFNFDNRESYQKFRDKLEKIL